MIKGTTGDLFAEARRLLESGNILEAVKTARRVSRQNHDRAVAAIHLAGILIDAGTDTKSQRLLRDAIRLLKTVDAESLPPEMQVTWHYYLANGYLALGQFSRGASPGTRQPLAEAISHFDAALKLQPDKLDVRTNLANALLGQSRCIEALDEYSQVLFADPEHAVARANRAQTLVTIHRSFWPHRGLLEAALADYELAIPLFAAEPNRQERCRKAIAHLKTKYRVTAGGPLPPQSELTPEQAWIWAERLALNPCPWCSRDSPGTYDVYVLHGQMKRPRGRTARVYDIINALHRTYGTGRWCLLQALGPAELPREHMVSAGGDREAKHGLRAGITLAGSSTLFSLFDQISFALNEYFRLGHQEHVVSFERVWSEVAKKGFAGDRHQLHPRLRRSAIPALAGLHQLAASLQRGLGRYSDLRNFRHVITHRILVPVAGVQQRGGVPWELVSENARRIGRLSRAALWYFGATLWWAEATMARGEQRKGSRILNTRTEVHRP